MDTEVIIRLWHINHDENGLEVLETPLCQRKVLYISASSVAMAVNNLPDTIKVTDTNFVEIETFDGLHKPMRIAYATLQLDDVDAWTICLYGAGRNGDDIYVEVLANSVASIATMLAASLVVADLS